MLRVQMPGERPPLVEDLSAQLAAEPLLSVHVADVRDQGGPLPEGPVALGALETRDLPVHRLDVTREVRLLAEPLAAVGAVVLHLVVDGRDVHLQGGVPGERLVADRALEPAEHLVNGDWLFIRCC